MVGYEMLAEPQRDITPEQSAEILKNLSLTHYRKKEGLKYHLSFEKTVKSLLVKFNPVKDFMRSLSAIFKSFSNLFPKFLMYHIFSWLFDLRPLLYFFCGIKFWAIKVVLEKNNELLSIFLKDIRMQVPLIKRDIFWKDNLQ